MDINLTVNVWFLVSLCLLCVLAGLIYGIRSKKRIERDHISQPEMQGPQYDRDRRYY